MDEEFIEFVSKFAEKRKKEIEENDLVVDFNEERPEVYLMLWGKLFIFDHKGYKIFHELWEKGVLTINKDGYLSVKDQWNDPQGVHRHLKMDEVKELAKKKKCDEKDIEVDHINNHEYDNRLTNLKPMHKDEHAWKHGFKDSIAMKKWHNAKKKIKK